MRAVDADEIIAGYTKPGLIGYDEEIQVIKDAKTLNVIVIPDGATNRDVYSLLCNLADDIVVNQPNFLHHTVEERNEYWDKQYEVK